MRRLAARSLTGLLGLALLFGSGGSIRAEKTPTPTSGTLLSADHDPLRKTIANAKAYAPSQLIVKYKSSVTQCVHCLLAKKQKFAHATTDASDSLDRLNQQCQIRGAKALFVHRCGKSTLTAQADQRRQRDTLHRQFAKRHRRVSQTQEENLPDLTNVYVLDVDPKQDVKKLCALYAQDPHVEYAQPNYKIMKRDAPNDPFYLSNNSWGQGYDDLWGLKKIDAEGAWASTQGAGVVVAVVDTGLDYTHADIAANVWTNPAEANGTPGVDDDQNGYLDDVRGWDFAYGDNDPKDGEGHGTHVAGTIAAAGNNGIGVVGVAYHANIMAVKGLDDTGSGYTSDLANGIVYAASNGADVINNSWGCSDPCPANPTIEKAVTTAMGLGSVVVFAAGNGNDDVALYSPENMIDPKPIVVASVDHFDQRSTYSSFGTTVDVAAPGGDSGPGCSDFSSQNILSLRAAETDGYAACGSNWVGQMVVSNNYYRARGTSMAAPHVSGVAALLIASQPAFTINDIKERLAGYSVERGAPGHDPQYGFGRINAHEAVRGQANYQLARIIWPRSGSLNGRTVTVRGTAAAKAFNRYDIFVGQGAAPTAWQTTGVTLTNGGTSKVIDGILGTWDASSVSSGDWTFRLVTADALGVSVEHRVTMTVDPSLLGGWPQQVGYGGGSYNSSMVVGDLDGDGTLEVVSGSYEGYLYAWHADGMRMAGFPVYVGGWNGDALTPSLGDVDGDGKLEVAVGANSTHPSGVGPTPDLHLLRFDGTEMPGWPKTSANYISDPITLADLDGNGDLELIFGEEDWKVHAYHHDGTPVTGWPVSVDNGQNVSGAAVGDVDGDHGPEIIIANDEQLYVWHADGTRMPGWPKMLGNNGISQPVLADLDGDGKQDIIVSISEIVNNQVTFALRVLRGDGSAFPGWPQATAGSSRLCVGNLAGDAKPELVAVGNDNYLRVFQTDGTALPGWPRSFGFSNPAWVSTCTIGDIDGDGQQEVVVPASDGSTQNFLYAFRADGTLLSGWPKSHVDYFQSPALTDLDRDGHVDVIAMAPYEGTAGVDVYVWGLASAYDSQHMDWPMYGQNPAHTFLWNPQLSAPSCASPLATFDATLQTPACRLGGCARCDSSTLLDSRGTIGGKSEANQPNTIASSCADGLSGTYHSDESIDQLIVRTVDGSALAPGKNAIVDATVWCWGTSDYLDLYYTADATSPSWTPIATNLQCAASSQTKTFSQSLTLVNAQGLHAVRAQFRYGGAASTCTVGSYNDHDDLVFQVGTTTNRPPTLNPIGNKTIDEGQPFSMTLTASDPDGNSLTFIGTNLPTGSTLNPTTGLFSWTPAFNQSGTYGITFTVKDPGGLLDFESITIVVKNVNNRAPTLGTVSNKTVNEGQVLSFTLSASDPDQDPLTYTMSPTPQGASLNAATGLFSWTPGFRQAGTYPVTFTAKDPFGLSATQTTTITVVDIPNQAPVLTPIGNRSVDEGDPLTIALSATDPENDPLTFSVTGVLPTGASLTASAGTFSWTPDFTQAGSYTVTFRVSDGALFDEETMSIFVVDATPRFVTIVAPNGGEVIRAGEVYPIRWKGNRIDTVAIMFEWCDSCGSWIEFSLPAAPLYDAVRDEYRYLWHVPSTFTTLPMQAKIEIWGFQSQRTVTDQSDNWFTILANLYAPVLVPINSKTVTAGSPISFTLVAVDGDNDSLVYGHNGLPTGASLNVSTGVFGWTPTPEQVGSYPIIFSVSDGLASDTEAVTITVTAGSPPTLNQPPVLAPIGNKTVKGLKPLTFTVSATDSDSSALSFTAEWLPAGASFNPSTRVFSWTPNLQLGTYQMAFTVSDGVSSDYEIITVTVVDPGPESLTFIAPAGGETLHQGQLYRIRWQGNRLLSFTIGYSACEGCLEWINFDTPGTYDPLTDQYWYDWPINISSGYFPLPRQVKIEIISGGHAYDSNPFTVLPANRPPVLEPIGNKIMNEGQFIEFDVVATDPDGDTVNYSLQGLPPGAQSVFMEQPNRLHVSWTPTYLQAGQYSLTAEARDGNPPDGLVDQETFTITVTNVPQPPVMDAIGNKTVEEGQLLTFKITASNPNNATLRFSSDSLPPGAALRAVSGVFTWVPSATQIGTREVTITVTDSLGESDSETILTTVTSSKSCKPSVASYDATLNAPSCASSSCGCASDALYSRASIKKIAELNQPNTLQSACADGVFGDYQADASVEWITVRSPNGTPLTAGETATLDVVVWCSSNTADNIDLYYTSQANAPSWVPLATNVKCVLSGDPTDFAPGNPYVVSHSFTLAPTAGLHVIRAQSRYQGSASPCTQGDYNDRDDLVFQVVASNQPPVLAPIGSQTVDEGQLLTFTLSATDPDGDSLTFGVIGGIDTVLPGATLDGATGEFRWTPTTTQAGTYQVTFGVTDELPGGALTSLDTETITITVTNVPQPDLVLTALATTTTVVRPGGAFYASSTAKNQGTAGASSVKTTFVLSSDTSVGGADDVALTGSRTISTLGIGLSSGGSATLTVPSTTPLGSYTLCAVVDAAKTIPEEEEGNNTRCLSTPLQVTKPDLVMQSLSGPATGVIGSPISLTDTVKNQGAVAASGFYVGYYLSADAVITTADARIGYRYVSGLAATTPNGPLSTTVTLPSTLTPATYTLGAIADFAGYSAETDETNNTFLGTQIVVSPGADLVLTSLSGPATGVTGSPIASTTTVANLGSGTAGDFYVGFYLSTDATITTTDTFLGNRYLGTLAIGASSTLTTTLTIPATLAPGTYTLGAIADYTNRRAETTETNNSLAGNQVVITPGADLVLTALSSPATGVTGTSLAIANNVTNQGTGSVSSLTIRFYLSLDATITTTDVYLGARSLSGLAVNASSAVTTSLAIPTTLTPGTYILGAIVDPTNQRPETNETNNTLAGNPIVITSGVDLVMTAISGPTAATRGTSIVLSSTVTNHGPGSSAGFYVGLYLSTDPVITTADRRLGARWVSSVGAAGTTTASSTASTTVTLPTSLTPATYFLGAIADFETANRVKESNETNNALAGIQVTIQ
ncbi:MAG: S8 family serine peptidase [Candidatus Omnitrophica bacterium]|nr:S8 family serine peptidase [Candidatus Omnitrophota bacterium]